MGCVRTKQNIPIVVKARTKDDESRIGNTNININNLSEINFLDEKEKFTRECSKKRKTGEGIKISTRNMIRQYKPTQIEENYKVLNKLGRGAFGSVFKIVHKTTGIIRAMKVIRKDCIKYQDDEKLFLKEIEILIKTDHPRVIKIYEYYQDEVNYYLITEYISGGDLYETITNFKTFDENQAANIMYQILSAVYYLHSNNIVHRDIKPENILVEKNESEGSERVEGENMINIKLIDFGTCNYYTTDKKMTLKVGTPYYIAPEVLQRNYTHKIDVWSCGVILYILLCGYPPFNGTNTQEILESVKRAKFSLEGTDWKNITSEAKNLIKKMLEYNPEKRITIEEAINSDFIKKYKQRKKINDHKFTNVLSNIKNFNAKEKFQQATLAYIVHFFYASNEIDDLRNIFLELDVNGDGRLTYQELRNGFDRIFGKQMTDIDFNNIIEDVDQDKNGFIEYQEFLRVGLNRKAVLSERHLQLAFEKMDEDGDGKLTIEEIKNILVTSDNEYISELLNSFDTNKDSEISYQEFVEMMRKVLGTSPPNSPKKSPKITPKVY